MTSIEVLSWVFVLVGLTGVWVSGKHYYGWLITTVFQAFWTYYAFAIDAPALAAQSLIFGLIALRNYFIGKSS